MSLADTIPACRSCGHVCPIELLVFEQQSWHGQIGREVTTKNKII
jgi:hypothetical protein